jgi:plastocyanin
MKAKLPTSILRSAQSEEDTMQKQLLGAIALGGLSLVGFTLTEPPVRAADNPETIEIKLDDNGNPVFAKTDVTIKVGQSIKWVPLDGKIPHHLFEGPTNKDDIKDISDGEFNLKALQTATHKFETAGPTIHYHCAIHRNTMNGTITVK